MSRRLLRRLAIWLAATLAVIVIAGAMLYVPDPGAGAPRVVVSVGTTTWNRLGLNRLTYIRRLRLAGLSPVVVDVAGFDPADVPSWWSAGRFEGLVLTGGGDVSPTRYGGDEALGLDVSLERDALEFTLLDFATAQGMPVLGLCRGAQLINVHAGGTLGDLRGDAGMHEAHRSLTVDHPITLFEDSRLREIFGVARIAHVTTWHGQHVSEPGVGFRITAESADRIPEAIESTGDRFVVGVQWHAEWPPWDPTQQPLFDAFAEAVRQR